MTAAFLCEMKHAKGIVIGCCPSCPGLPTLAGNISPGYRQSSFPCTTFFGGEARDWSWDFMHAKHAGLTAFPSFMHVLQWNDSDLLKSTDAFLHKAVPFTLPFLLSIGSCWRLKGGLPVLCCPLWWGAKKVIGLWPPSQSPGWPYLARLPIGFPWLGMGLGASRSGLIINWAEFSLNVLCLLALTRRSTPLQWPAVSRLKNGREVCSGPTHQPDKQQPLTAIQARAPGREDQPGPNWT